MAIQVLESKEFHNGNLVLEIAYDTELKLHFLRVHRLRPNEYVDLWGVNRNEADARRKFDTIRL